MEHRGMLRPTRSSLSAVGKRCSQDNTLYIHITPPLPKPGVVRWFFLTGRVIVYQ